MLDLETSRRFEREMEEEDFRVECLYKMKVYEEDKKLLVNSAVNKDNTVPEIL